MGVFEEKGSRCVPGNEMEEIYEGTASKVRVNRIEGESFYTNRGVRQGCSLSPALFAAFLGDIY